MKSYVAGSKEISERASVQQIEVWKKIPPAVRCGIRVHLLP